MSSTSSPDLTVTVDEQKQVVEFHLGRVLVGRFTPPDIHHVWKGWITETAVAAIAGLIAFRKSALEPRSPPPTVDVTDQ